uniref:Uncharacterized protein n=1 Tax=Micrurus surinamensis TaxID=129470 RepID=A0A2D4NXF2_MICSU
MKFKMLECKRVREEKGPEHTTEQTNIITLHYCIQYGSKKTKKPQKNFDMYNHQRCSFSATFKQVFVPLPQNSHYMASYLYNVTLSLSLFFETYKYFALYYPAKLKNIYCGSLLVFLFVCVFPLLKKVTDTLF